MTPVHLLSTGSDRWGEPLADVQRKRLAVLRAICPVTIVGYAPAGTVPPVVDGVRFALVPEAARTPLRQARLLAATLGSILRLSRSGMPVVAVAQTPYHGLAALLARDLARLAGRPVAVVVEAHGDWMEVPRMLGLLPRWSGNAIRALSRIILARADLVRTVSGFTNQLVQPLTRAPVVTFPAFTDLDLFLRAADPATARTHWLFAGALTPVKGLDTLLEALARLAFEGLAIPLVVAGDGPDRAALEARARSLGLGGRTCFVGHVDQERLAALMRSAVALVLPTRSEGFGLVLIEAMATETPVVASRVPGVRELVEDGLTGRLVEPGYPGELADALRALASDPTQARQMGTRGREFVRARFVTQAWAGHQRRMIARATAAATGGVVGDELVTAGPTA